LFIEIEGARFAKQKTDGKKDSTAKKLRDTKLLVGSLHAQLYAKNEKISGLQG
jgi:hypothetical protein